MPFPSLILASGSAIRKTMLEKAGIACTVIKPTVDEEALRPSVAHLVIPQQAVALAKAKGQSVAATHSGLVLGADQICELEGAILSKPGNHENAVKQLTRMQGRTHYLHSAAALFNDGKEVWSVVESVKLTMRKLTAEEIANYLLLDKPYSSCGSYTYEVNGHALFTKVEGDKDAIPGLPMKPLLDFLTSHA